MDIDNKTEIPDFSHIKRNQVPHPFTWKIDDIYSSLKEWEADKSRYLEMMDKIDELKQRWTESPTAMHHFLDYITQIEKIEEKVYSYPRLYADTDMQNSKWQALKGEVHTHNIRFRTMLAFMNPDILSLGREKIDQYIAAEPRLKIYQMTFDSILRMKDHILSTDKEEIMTQTGLFSGATRKAADMLNDVDIPAPRITLSDGKRVKLNTPNYVRYRESRIRTDRMKVMKTFWTHHANYKNTLANLLDGAIKNHYFDVKIRNYPDCLTAALFSDNIDTQVYHTLIQTVNQEIAPLHRFLQLKARLLNISPMSYEDIYASAVPSVEKHFSIEEARDIVHEALRPLGEEYTNVLHKALNGRWMDIYPNKAKRSGAYSSGVYGVHPFVLMNYNGTFNHVSTLAHEFGHALHSWFSDNNQSYPQAQYPIFLAEIASTFNETLLVHYMLKTIKDDHLKLYILDQYLDEFRGTMYRQTLFAEFELAMHQEVEKGQTLTPEWLDNTYLQLTCRYYGHDKGILVVPGFIENEWSYVHHFYYNFYVYQYSTGIAAATMLAEMVLNGGKNEAHRYLNFLKSGGSRYPLHILKDTGVDLTSPQPVHIALKRFDSVIDEMEAILQRLAK